MLNLSPTLGAAPELWNDNIWDRLLDSLHVDQRPPAIAPIGALQRDQRVYAVRAYELPIAEGYESRS